MGNITQQTAQRIIDEYCQGSSTYELADKYGLGQTSICNLISGRTWSQCERPENIKDLIEARHKKGLFKSGCKDHLHEQYPPLTIKQKEILMGSLLGDGCLHKTYPTHPNSYFGKKQCKKYKEYLDWHLDELSPFSNSLQREYSEEQLVAIKGGLIERHKVPKYLAAYIFRTCSHPIFTEMRKEWYPQGKKIIPLNLKLTPLTIAVWFCDDGNNHFRNRESQIATQSFTMEEANFLCQLLREFEVKPSVTIKISSKTGVEQPILKCNSTSYDNLIDLIRPHVIWGCMSHKIKWRKAKKQWEYSSNLTEQDIFQIYELSKTHKQHEIAKKFGVHKNTISSILRGDSWQHLSEFNPYIPKCRRRKLQEAESFSFVNVNG